MHPKKDRVLELAEIIYGQVEFSLPFQFEEPIPFAPDYDPVDHVDLESIMHPNNEQNSWANNLDF